MLGCRGIIMKGKIAVILCLLILPLISLAFVTPAKAADGSSYGWVEPAYVGEDMYYDTNIVGYLTGTNWNFTFSWVNYYNYQINVTALRMYFGWGKNYTSAYSTTIPAGATKIFSFVNVTPTLLEAPEQIGPFSYRVFIHHANNTVAPYNDMVIDPGIYNYNFAVLSPDHLACLNIWAKYTMFFGSSPLMMLPQGSMFPFGSNITDVQVKFLKAMLELEQGMQIFQAGVFGTAKTHLQAGDAYFTDALTTWSTKGTAIEEADLASKQAQTTYYTALGDANKMNSYGWILFGLGWMFIGIGIIIYGARKPKVVVQS
jgi:hypothetical protein